MAALCCLALASCGNSKTNGSGDSAENGVEGTASESTETTAAASAEEASVPGFMSDDLKAHALRGQVKKVNFNATWPDVFMTPFPEELTFNAGGKNTTEFYDDYEAMRKQDGINVKMRNRFGTDGTEAATEYLSLNEYGHPLKASYEAQEPGIGDVKATFVFSDYVYDSRKNWTSRKVTSEYTIVDYETDATKNKSGSWTETQTIVYY